MNIKSGAVPLGDLPPKTSSKFSSFTCSSYAMRDIPISNPFKHLEGNPLYCKNQPKNKKLGRVSNLLGAGTKPRAKISLSHHTGISTQEVYVDNNGPNGGDRDKTKLKHLMKVCKSRPCVGNRKHVSRVKSMKELKD